MITAIIAGRRRRRLPVVDMMMSSVRRAKSNAKSKKIEVRDEGTPHDEGKTTKTVRFLGICIICTETENVTELLSNGPHGFVAVVR